MEWIALALALRQDRNEQCLVLVENREVGECERGAVVLDVRALR
jgi:hypothetical protein